MRHPPIKAAVARLDGSSKALKPCSNSCVGLGLGWGSQDLSVAASPVAAAAPRPLFESLSYHSSSYPPFPSMSDSSHPSTAPPSARSSPERQRSEPRAGPSASSDAPTTIPTRLGFSSSYERLPQLAQAATTPGDNRPPLPSSSSTSMPAPESTGSETTPRVTPRMVQLQVPAATPPHPDPGKPPAPPPVRLAFIRLSKGTHSHLPHV